MYKIDQLLSLFNERIETLQYPHTPENLYAPIRYILVSDGKRIRPVMVLIACNLFSDEIEQAMEPALAIEIFHNFTLLHDDIMDKAQLRRGRECVHLKWSENSAILSGDTMSVLAYHHLARVSGDVLPSVLTAFNELSVGVCEGQQYDMDFETQEDVSIDDYLKMITLKTSVLMAGALKIGALVGGASKEESEKLYRVGICLGVAFQILDDLLDMYATESVFGKMIGGDVISGKKSYLYLKALEKSSSAQRNNLITLYNDTTLDPETKIGCVRDLYDRLQVREDAIAMADRYSKQALDIIERIEVGELRKSTLKELSLLLLNREK